LFCGDCHIRVVIMADSADAVGYKDEEDITKDKDITKERRYLMPAEYTSIHNIFRKTLEELQDFIVLILTVLLLLLMLKILYSISQLVLYYTGEPRDILGEVLFILISIELYRTLIVYLRDHRVSVPLMVELVIVTVLREAIVTDLIHMSPTTIIAVSVFLVVLAGLLALSRRIEPAEEPDVRPRKGILSELAELRKK